MKDQQFLIINGILASVADMKGDFVIPDTVTAIADGLFENQSVTSVTIPNTITKIENDTFAYCKKLTSVNIPESVTWIGTRAFVGCESLTEITIPESVTELESYAFQACAALQKVNIAANITALDSYVFKKCTSLTDITFPSTIKTIGKSAFEECTALESIALPEQLEYIDVTAFRDCTSLRDVQFPDSLLELGVASFHSCPALKSVHIPASLDLFDLHCLGFYMDENNKEQQMTDFTIYGYTGSMAHGYALHHEFTFIPVDQPESISGDVDCNGEVDISDAILLARYTAEDVGISLTDEGKKNADVNADGKYTAEDTVYIIRIIARLV